MSAAFYEDDGTAGEQALSFREAVRRLWPLLAEHKRRLAAYLGLLVAATGGIARLAVAGAGAHRRPNT